MGNIITHLTDLYNCTAYATIASTMSKRLLLASQSPRRRELLALLGLPFEVTVADVAEDPLANESPAAAVVRLSQAKARAACAGRGRGVHSRRGCPAAIIIACDTIVALDGELLGKPRDAAEAISVLRRLRGRSHTVFSAVTLLEPAAGRTSSDVAETRLVMRTYTDAEMAAYVASGDPLDKAGAYAIQHPGFHPVAELHGCYANVMGLALCHLTRCLRAWNIEPHHDVPAACQAHIGRRCPVYATILAGRPSEQTADNP
jgi:septum formation protein